MQKKIASATAKPFRPEPTFVPIDLSFPTTFVDFENAEMLQPYRSQLASTVDSQIRENTDIHWTRKPLAIVTKTKSRGTKELRLLSNITHATRKLRNSVPFANAFQVEISKYFQTFPDDNHYAYCKICGKKYSLTNIAVWSTLCNDHLKREHDYTLPESILKGLKGLPEFEFQSYDEVFIDNHKESNYRTDLKKSLSHYWEENGNEDSTQVDELDLVAAFGPFIIDQLANTEDWKEKALASFFQALAKIIAIIGPGSNIPCDLYTMILVPKTKCGTNGFLSTPFYAGRAIEDLPTEDASYPRLVKRNYTHEVVWLSDELVELPDCKLQACDIFARRCLGSGMALSTVEYTSVFASSNEGIVGEYVLFSFVGLSPLNKNRITGTSTEIRAAFRQVGVSPEQIRYYGAALTADSFDKIDIEKQHVVQLNKNDTKYIPIVINGTDAFNDFPLFDFVK